MLCYGEKKKLKRIGYRQYLTLHHLSIRVVSSQRFVRDRRTAVQIMSSGGRLQQGHLVGYLEVCSC